VGVLRIDRRSNQRPGKQAGPEADRRTATAPRTGTDERSTGPTNGCARAGRIAWIGSTRGQPDGQKNGGHDRWHKISFHDALESKVNPQTDVAT
jgi:hypothetical protein